MRDANNTVVQLKPGFNIITLEDYPGLKYGFKSTAEDTGECCITRIYLNHFDSSEVTDMSDMFLFMDSLKFIDFTDFDTSNVVDMNGAFNSCYDLEAIDLSRFDTSKVERMDSMFYSCNYECALDLSHFDMSNVKDVEDMFNGNCLIDISNWSLNTAVEENNIFGYGPLNEIGIFVMKNVTEFTRNYFEKIFDAEDDEPENIIT